MPTISYFYGIIIVMYLRNKEHNPPHIHAITQDFDAPFLVSTGELMEGEYPPKGPGVGERICDEISERASGDVGDGEVYQAAAAQMISGGVGFSGGEPGVPQSN